MHEVLDLTHHWVGGMIITIFVFAYSLVMAEEFIHMRKCKAVLIATGLIWVLVGLVYVKSGMGHLAEDAFRHDLLEFAEIFLFLLVAMSYINALTERNVFEALRSWLVRRGLGLKQMFWLTGVLAFFISPIADNLTTALLMGAVTMSVGKGNSKFITLGCINIVVAANAGGAFSPFGDITTLMVWQRGVVSFGDFFYLFLPSLVNWLVPAFVMSFFVPDVCNVDILEKQVKMRKGAKRIMSLFFATIMTAIIVHAQLHMPPMMGMMLGLGYLNIFGFWLKKNQESSFLLNHKKEVEEIGPYDILKKVERAGWDTLLFFYGIILCVGGIKFIGYLDLMSSVAYDGYGPMFSNIAVGLSSAILDNIPVMFAVLSMMPEMSEGHWLLVTLTAGVGGSLLSIGSTAGVALMGQAKGHYTFMKHLKWTPVIALGYAASILVHLIVNYPLF